MSHACIFTGWPGNSCLATMETWTLDAEGGRRKPWVMAGAFVNTTLWSVWALGGLVLAVSNTW